MPSQIKHAQAPHLKSTLENIACRIRHLVPALGVRTLKLETSCIVRIEQKYVFNIFIIVSCNRSVTNQPENQVSGVIALFTTGFVIQDKVDAIKVMNTSITVDYILKQCLASDL